MRRVVCTRMAGPALWQVLLHMNPLMSSLLQGQEDSAPHIIQRQRQDDRLPQARALWKKYDSIR